MSRYSVTPLHPELDHLQCCLCCSKLYLNGKLFCILTCMLLVLYLTLLHPLQLFCLWCVMFQYIWLQPKTRTHNIVAIYMLINMLNTIKYSYTVSQTISAQLYIHCSLMPVLHLKGLAAAGQLFNIPTEGLVYLVWQSSPQARPSWG